MGKVIYSQLLKLRTSLTRSRYSKFLPRDDGANGINCVNNQVSIHIEYVEKHLHLQMFTLSYTALIYPQGMGNITLIKEEGTITYYMEVSLPYVNPKCIKS